MGMRLLGVSPLASLREMRRDPDLPERVQRHLEREIERRSASPELEQGRQHDEVGEQGVGNPD